MRKPTTVEVMLLSAIGLWALNLTVSRYILTHGFQPLAYSTVRYALASLVFIGIVLVTERSLRIERRDLGLVVAAAATLFVNQIGFVYALKTTSASVIALILAATPIFAALIGLAFGTEVLPRRFWAGAALSVAGVALVALGAGGEIGGDAAGILCGILTAATWAVYSILITPLMARYSPSRISAVVLPLSWVGIALIGLPQTRSQDWSLGWEVWVLLVFATLGPLVITNILWFHSLDRIGASRATLATNLQPFAAAICRRRPARGDDRHRPDRRRRADRRRDPRRAAAIARLPGGVAAERAVRCADDDEPAEAHRSRLGRRRGGADGDQARHGSCEQQPRSHLRGAALGHRPRRGAAHVLRDRRRRPAGRPLASLRPRQGGAPGRARRGRRAAARQRRRRRPSRSHASSAGSRSRRRPRGGCSPPSES